MNESLNTEDINNFSDLDLNDINNDKERLDILNKKIKNVKNLYDENNEAMNALNEQVSLINKFHELQKNKGLTPVEKDFKIERKNNLDEKDDEETSSTKLKDNIIQENQLEQPGCCSRCTSCFSKILTCLTPFKGDIRYLEYNFNSTIVTLFQLIRFLFLLSIAQFFILFILFLSHSGKKSGNTKYNLPRSFFYSSYSGEKEFYMYSNMYALNIFVFTLASIIYYFKKQSEHYKENAFIKNNQKTLLSSYIFTCWNINIRDAIFRRESKEKIFKDLQDYSDEYVFKLDYAKQESTWTPGRIGCVIFSYMVFILILFFYFWYTLFSLGLRNSMRNKEYAEDYKGKDSIADFVSYLFIAFGFLFFPFISGFISKIEGWKIVSSQNKSINIKRSICIIWGLFALCVDLSYFTLKGKKKDDFFLKSMTPDIVSFFTCPGNFEDQFEIYYSTTPGTPETQAAKTTRILTRILADDNNPSSIPNIYDKGYSKCREEEFGANVFMIVFVYLLLYLFIELIHCMFNCCSNCCSSIGQLCPYFCPCCVKNKTKLSYYPVLTLLHIFTVYCLFCLTVVFMPFASIFLPIILLIEFKYQFRKLKTSANFNYDDINVKARGNAKSILHIFALMQFVAFVSLIYFFVIKLPHFNQAVCVGDGTKSILYQTSKNEDFCGPAGDNVRIAYGMTYKIRNFWLIGWFHEVFKEALFIMLLLTVILCAIIYRNYSPNQKYYDYIINRQQEMLETFQLLYDQIGKRDKINYLLLKMAKLHNS